MTISEQMWHYYRTRLAAQWEQDRDRGEVSATTVALAALLVLAAIAVGGIIRAKVTAKAESIQL
jgi:hypothetical protein